MVSDLGFRFTVGFGHLGVPGLGFGGPSAPRIESLGPAASGLGFRIRVLSFAAEDLGFRSFRSSGSPMSRHLNRDL